MKMQRSLLISLVERIVLALIRVWVRVLEGIGVGARRGMKAILI